MTKYTNPFWALKEAQSILKALGANPVSNPKPSEGTEKPLGATYPFPWGKQPEAVEPDTVYWPEQVLSIMVDKVYADGCNHYYEVKIHLTAKGFERIKEIICTDPAFEVYTREHAHGFKEHILEPSPGLVLFTLEQVGTV